MSPFISARKMAIVTQGLNSFEKLLQLPIAPETNDTMSDGAKFSHVRDTGRLMAKRDRVTQRSQKAFVSGLQLCAAGRGWLSVERSAGGLGFYCFRLLVLLLGLLFLLLG